MFRALLWKEWRQLALIRWGGVALGALVPVAIRAGAVLTERGVLPAGNAAAARPRDLMFELLPATLALGVWPLIALMSASQSFAGDRGSGTEAFLVERPVRRSTVWCARLLASFGTLMAVIVSTAVIAATSAALTGAPPGIGWSRWEILASAGLGISVLGYLGSVVAASLLSSPMGALLLGAVLGSLPAILAAELATFAFVQVRGVALGLVLPALLLPAYLVAAWSASCRGEPAGRGRIRRSVSMLAAALAAVLVLFVLLAPAVLRVNAGFGGHAIYTSPKGDGLFVGATEGPGVGGGWIASAASGQKRAFVPPPIREVTWSPDGSHVAFLTWSGPFGSMRPHARIDIRSTADGEVLRTIPVADEEILYSVAWADAGLVTVVSRDSSRKEGRVNVEIVDPTTGASRPTGFQAGYGTRLVGPTDDGKVFAQEVVESDTVDGKQHPTGYSLRPIDVAAARVGPPIADASGRPLQFSGWGRGLSPNGRFALVTDVVGDPNTSHVVDLQAVKGDGVISAPRWSFWVDGDRLIWRETLEHRTRMFVGTPGGPPRPIREWREANVGIFPSPDRRAVFVSVLPAGGAPSAAAGRAVPDTADFQAGVTQGSATEEIVYLPGEDRFVTLGHPFSDRPSDQRYSVWAGPKTLARIAPGVVYLEDIDRPGALRFVIGGSRDLE